ncbi:MAG: S1 RNA-binding domain-containing protein [Ruminococcus sp.]|jgi:S1 RNA binding domain protein|nr:S1 RNA-binding domain-containing protein [Ruminococcus sp.]
MQFETGKIYEGKVTGITKFGAFVELEPGCSGMVHISEVANRYVENITDVLSVSQAVKVMVTSISDDGKIALSIKKAESPPRLNNSDRTSNINRGNNTRNNQNRQQTKPATFEDMMSAFKKTSDEKLGDIKRQGDKRGGNRSGRH